MYACAHDSRSTTHTNSRSNPVRLAARGIGQPYGTKIVSIRRRDVNITPDRRTEIHPHGKVPAIDHDGVIVFESSAKRCISPMRSRRPTWAQDSATPTWPVRDVAAY